jgi:hypothetical protein
MICNLLSIKNKVTKERTGFSSINAAVGEGNITQDEMKPLLKVIHIIA